MKDITKKYDNGEITVVWRPAPCTHSANCVKGLPSVFNVTASHWIDITGADTKAIVNR